MRGAESFNDEQRQRFERLDERYQVAVRLALGMTPEGFKDNYDSYGPLEGALDLLPLFDRNHTRAVCDAMIRSPDEETRMRLVSCVDTITRHDVEYGVELWGSLLGDPSRDVRKYAHEILESHLEGCQHPDETATDVLVRSDLLGQLTWRDATNLLRTYIEAEVEGRTYELGAVVLAASDALPPDASDMQAPGADPTVA